MSRSFSKFSLLIIIVIAAVASGLSLISYQHSTATANQIMALASHEARSNTEIQAQDLAAILANKVGSVSTNLQLMAEATTVQNHDIQSAIPLFTSARKSTGDFASSYFWVDKDGKLLWADAFTNKTIEQQYNGGDRSYRDYYLKPRETMTPYYTTVIESVDNVPRLYIGYPIVGNEGNDTRSGGGINNNNSSSSTATDSIQTFKGVIVAAINIDTLGKFAKDQLEINSSSTTGLLDKKGLVLYSSGTPQYVGKNIFSPEIQSVIPADVKEPFNQLIKDSLAGKSGAEDLSSQGKTSTIAFRPVTIGGNEFANLYVITPHQLAGNAVALIGQQRVLNASIIIAIGVVAAGIAVIVLTWNKRLAEIVATRTSELKFANESLIDSNKQLQTANTRLEQANKQLAQANEQLKLHDKMQKEFINVAAHELRTPTQAILGFSELMQQENNGPEDVKAATAAISRNASRLQRLAEDILVVTRIEGHSLKMEKERFDLNEKIEHVIEDAKRSIVNGNRTDIIFERTEPQLPVIADKTRVFQVVSNLLNNALKFTKNGTIIIKAEKKGDEQVVVVSVKDNGRGIDSEIMPRLFTKFATKSETGTGLGLYISKNIIEAHGGKIWAENNKEGHGATFYFTLPIAPVEEEEEEQKLNSN